MQRVSSGHFLVYSCSSAIIVLHNSNNYSVLNCGLLMDCCLSFPRKLVIYQVILSTLSPSLYPSLYLLSSPFSPSPPHSLSLPPYSPLSLTPPLFILLPLSTHPSPTRKEPTSTSLLLHWAKSSTHLPSTRPLQLPQRRRRRVIRNTSLFPIETLYSPGFSRRIWVSGFREMV